MDRGARDYVPEINALRCYAMLAVMLVHSGVLPVGAWGVWLFFVISGFAITRSLLADESGPGHRGARLKAFFVKRALRILPLYLFYLGVVAAYAAAFHRDSFFAALPYLLTFTYNLAMALGSPTGGAAGVQHLWSLSGEEQFYLLFPILFVFLPRQRFAAAMAAMLVICPLLRALLSATDHSNSAFALAERIALFTPAHFDAFAAGALVSIATYRRQISVRMGTTAVLAGLLVVLAYLGIFTALQAERNGQWSMAALHDILSGTIAGDGREIVAYTAVWIASAGLILAIIAQVPAVCWLMRPRLLNELGKISYGGYVYHGLAIELLDMFTPLRNTGGLPSRCVFFGGVFAIAMSLAWLSYRFLEQPFLRRKPGPIATAPIRPFVPEA